MRSPTRKAKHGMAPRQAQMSKANPKRRGRKKRSRINQLGLVAFIAFVFFTQRLDNSFWLNGQRSKIILWRQLHPIRYILLRQNTQLFVALICGTMARVMATWKNQSSPMDVTSNEGGAVALAYDDGTEVAKSNIQTIIDMELRIDGEVIAIPSDGLPYRSKANAILTQDGNEVWWPGKVLVLISAHMAHALGFQSMYRVELTRP